MMSRIDEEKRTMEAMVRLYCRRKEGNKELCDDCKAVMEYANKRLSACRFGERKPTCRLCTVHCYRPDMRRRVSEIMRYAGPRMMLHHPMMAIRHILREIIKGKKVKR